MRVRDPVFRDERILLVDEFGQWFAAPSQTWPQVATQLRVTLDSDARRAYKDLVSARWLASGKRTDWDQLVLAALNDGTALDLILGRLFGEVLRRQRAGTIKFSEADLIDAIRICNQVIETNRPWETGAPAYG